MAYTNEEFSGSESSMTIDDHVFTPQSSEPGVSYCEPGQQPISISDQREPQPSLCCQGTTVTEILQDGQKSPWKNTNPWPGNTYKVVEKTTGRALTLHNGEPVLMELENKCQKATRTAHYTWLCCEKNNYWGFQSTETGKYFGHDGWRGGMRVSATNLDCWEMFVARQLPEGGYQLLMPHHASTLYMIAIAEDRCHLTRRMDGGAVWEFCRI